MRAQEVRAGLPNEVLGKYFPVHNIQEFHIYDSSHTYIHTLRIPFIQNLVRGTKVQEYKIYNTNTNYRPFCIELFIKISTLNSLSGGNACSKCLKNAEN
jgi:hypothetical protein